jgi:hypothetical protein
MNSIVHTLDVIVCVGFMVLTAATQRSPVDVNRLFEATYDFHLRGGRVSQARKQRQTGNKLSGMALRNGG